MATGGNPGAKTVGKVAIRAIPDTSKFRGDLRDKLTAIEKAVTFKVNVNRAALNRKQIREQIQAQLDRITNLRAVVNVKAKIDAEPLRDLYDDIKRMTLDLLPAHELAKIKADIARLKKHIEDQDPNLDVFVNPNTAYANARFRWLSRPRQVEFIPNVNQGAWAKAATQLAALSGLRLSWRWIDELTENIANLDRSLPRLGVGITGITTLVSSLIATVGGLVGILAGLSSILPAFLVVPGAIMQAVAGITVLIVALRKAGTQLAPLSDSMNELAGIMQGAFWAEARQPIIDLITNLMPQMRAAFHDAASGMGVFTSALARAFAQETSGGRFSAILAGLGDTFRVLATGAEGFAGAIVSLGQIAAQYMPRLAQWFVDLADRFDAWLKATAEDGRMTQWIDGAIEGLHQLWDITVATVDIFRGLWDAAERAGGGGLAGFRDAMQRIADIVNSPGFQITAESFFRGAGEAMRGLQPALSAIGDLFRDLRAPIEYFIGTAGQTFGLLIKEIADALNTPEMGAALAAFVDGFKKGIEGLAPYLPSIVDGFAKLATFAGELAAAIGPVLGAALATFAELLGKVLDKIGPELPALTQAIVDAIVELTPKLLELADKVLPLLPDLLAAIVELLPQLVDLFTRAWPAISTAVDILVDFVELALTPTKDAMQDFADFLSGLGPIGELIAPLFEGLGEIASGGLPGIIDAIAGFGQSILDTITAPFQTAAGVLSGIWATISSLASSAWSNLGLILGGIVMNIRDVFTGNFGAVKDRIADFVQSARDKFDQFRSKAGEVVSGVVGFFRGLPGQIASAFAGAANWLVSAGRDIVNGLLSGIRSAAGKIASTLIQGANSGIQQLKDWLGIHSPSTRLRDEVGRWMPAGVVEGIKDGMPDIKGAVRHMVELPSRPSIATDAAAAVAGPSLTVNVHNPVSRDPIADIREAASLLIAGLNV